MARTMDPKLFHPNTFSSRSQESTTALTLVLLVSTESSGVDQLDSNPPVEHKIGRNISITTDGSPSPKESIEPQTSRNGAALDIS